MSEEAVITIIVIACATALVLGAIALIKPICKLSRRLSPIVCNYFRDKNASVDDWDRVSLLYRVPSHTAGFLMLEYFVLWITIAVSGDGLRALDFESFFGLWLVVIAGLDSIIGILGVIGIVCATVYGVHQELPDLRIKTLVAIGICGVMIGLGIRFHKHSQQVMACNPPQLINFTSTAFLWPGECI